jgi:hypothetical protein
MNGSRSGRLRELGLEARPLRFVRTVAQQLGCRVGAAGYPHEARVEDIEQTAYSGEQEHRRERHLDNVGYVLRCTDFGNQRGGLRRDCGVEYVATVITSLRFGRRRLNERRHAALRARAPDTFRTT